MHQEIKATVIWLALAFLLTFAGFWQAKVAIASASQARHRALPPPAKTKHAIRPPAADFTGDVVDDYLARCEKGMTDQQIGWILEDFRSAGLDFERRGPTVTLEENLHRRAAQYHWYHDTLVEGLHLTPEQSAHVTSKLQEWEKSITAGLGDARSDWLPGPNLVETDPRGLCALTSHQEALIAEGPSYGRMPDSMLYRDMFPAQSHSAARTGPPDSSLDALDSKVRQFLFEPTGFIPSTRPLHTFRVPLWDAARAFPFLQSQEFDHYDREKLLSGIRKLHPEQLRMILLNNPQLATDLQTDLEAAAR